MKRSLSIKTTDRERIEVCLLKDGQKIDCIEKSRLPQAEAVLPAIEELLIRHKLALNDIQAIEVDTGPGSFTGLRVGIAIANVLGVLLNVAINDLPKRTLVYPVYTQSKFDSELSHSSR